MTTHVSLMGGLGNQLFQLALGLYLSPKEILYLNPILKNSRTNLFGEPEILSLRLPDRVKVESIPFFDAWFVERLLGRGLRMASARSSSLLPKFIELFLNQFSQPFLPKVRFASGLGSEIQQVELERVLHVGYFQTHVFSSESSVLNEMMKLKPVRNSERLEELVDIVQDNRPIMIHVRLTDYVNEGAFGLLGPGYYRSAISLLDSTLGKRDIWVFSDDPNLAMSRLPKEYSDRYRLVPQLEETAHDFNLMRHFSGYVVANSSFSWWGAQLRHDRSAPVIHPWPWFKSNLHDKEDFFPGDWAAIDSFF